MTTNRLAKLGWKVLNTGKVSKLEVLNLNMWQIKELEAWIAKNYDAPEAVRIAVYERIDALEKAIDELQKPSAESVFEIKN